MRKTPYHSVRIGKSKVPKLDLDEFTTMFLNVYSEFNSKDYFQYGLGYECVDRAEHQGGKVGGNPDAFLFRKTGKKGLWPPRVRKESAPWLTEEGLYTEDDIFDLIEFLFDCVAKPIEGRMHSYNNCGYHVSKVDGPAGEAEFRAEINEILALYGSGYELAGDGEEAQIRILPASGMQELVQTELPKYDPENVENKVVAATNRFLSRHSSHEERKEAVRALADVLEFLAPQIKAHFTTTEKSTLFNLINNFGIRHHNQIQQKDYDPVWLNWMYYFFLATIHTLLGIIGKTKDIDPDVGF